MKITYTPPEVIYCDKCNFVVDESEVVVIDDKDYHPECVPNK